MFSVTVMCVIYVVFVTVKIYRVTWVMTPCSEKCISAPKTEVVGTSAMLRAYQIMQCDKSQDRCVNNVGCARLSILTLCVFFVLCHIFQFFFSDFLQFEKYCQKVN
jgi:hypothetical protein